MNIKKKKRKAFVYPPGLENTIKRCCSPKKPRWYTLQADGIRYSHLRPWLEWTL